MIRLAFSTLGCPSWPLARVLDSASRLGYDGVELRFIEGDDALWSRPELTGSGLRETLARLADAGLAVPCVDTRSFFHSPDPAARRTAVEEAARTAEVAARLGARGIRVFGDRVQPGADLASTRGWIVEALGDASGPPPGHRGRGVARDARRLRHRRRHPLDPGGGGSRGARRGLGPGQRLLGVRGEARGGRRGARTLPAPRPPEGRAAPARRADPLAPGSARSRRLPGRARARVADGERRHLSLGLLRVGEALAPRDRRPGGGTAALPRLGRGRPARARHDRGPGGTAPGLRPPPCRGLPEPHHDGRRGRPPRRRRDSRRRRARRPGRRHLRLRPLAERVPGRAPGGAGGRLAEAHRVPPRRVRRDPPTTRPPSAASSSIGSSPT